MNNGHDRNASKAQEAEILALVQGCADLIIRVSTLIAHLADQQDRQQLEIDRLKRGL